MRIVSVDFVQSFDFAGRLSTRHAASDDCRMEYDAATSLLTVVTPAAICQVPRERIAKMQLEGPEEFAKAPTLDAEAVDDLERLMRGEPPVTPDERPPGPAPRRTRSKK